MGNQILGKRSRNFFKGFNDRQVDYIKEKFSVMAKNIKDKEGERTELDKTKFIQEYKLTQVLADRFFELMNFDEVGGIDEYEFICAVHSFCNMTVSELGETLFSMVTSKFGKESLTQKDLMSFTEVCIRYNASLQNKNLKPQEIQKINKDKFRKYDYDKNKSISKDQFKAICTKDEDYKKWFFNMGFITKNQLQFNDQVYDLVDSDVDDEIQRHLTKTDPKKDKLKRGFQHKIPEPDDFAEDDDEGDQSAPPAKSSDKKAEVQKQKILKKWQTYTKNCQYSSKFKQNKNSPSQTLTMKYVFGYRSFDCRNNIKFDTKGNAVYHQGAVGIVMDKDNKQKFMNQHKDDIVCLDINGYLVATGEMGTKPSVILWDSSDQVMKSKLILTDELKESVGNVAFNKGTDGPDFLAVNCNDSDHTLIVYKLNKKEKKDKKDKKDEDYVGFEIKSKGVLSKNAILDLKFTPNSQLIVAASLKQILFVKYDGSILNASRGQFGQFSNSCALCLLPVQSEWKKEKKNWMLSGMTNGSIYFWEQDKCKIARPGHSGSVSALAQIDGKGNNLFVSGDKSGNIYVWDHELKISNKCSIAQTQGFSNMIVSLSVYNSDEILVGTKSSNVYRAILQKDLLLNERHTIMSGHCEGNLWGLTVEQTDSFFFYTGGQDQRLMKWKYGTQNKLEKEIKCKYKIRSLSHNPTNSVLAVGYMNGVIQIFTEDLKPLSNDNRSRYEKIKNPDKEVLNLLKFKRDGKSLAACYTLINTAQSKKQTWGYKVIIFSFDKSLKEQKSIQLSSKVISLDFDEKGEYLRLNTQNKEFIVYEMKGETPVEIKQNLYNKRVKQAQWESHTAFMSPQTKGFKTEGVEEADIVCCERNRRNRNVVLMGDKYSNIKLFNYPCVKYPIFSKYQGHSNAITAMEFNSGKGKNNSEYLISIGGQQKSIIVWQYDPDLINNQEFFNEDRTEINKEDVISEFQKPKGQEKPANPQYIGQIKQPSHFKQTCNPRRDNKLPDQNLSIEHVFGIRNQYLLDEVRNMCRFSENFQSIIFPTACLGVEMNIKTKKQKYYHEHKEDIVSFAMDKSRRLIATGQMAEKNAKDPRKKIVSICVWDAVTHKLLNKLNGFHTIAVVLLEFSPSGQYLFSVGNDDKNTYAVYDWKAGTVVYSGPVSGGKVNGIAWKNQNEFATCGMDHVKFWQKGKGKQGKFQGKNKLQPMFSCLYYNDDKDEAFITGGGSGTVFVWRGNATVSSVRAHGNQKIQISKQSKPSMKVHTIVQRFKRIYTGGDDGIINEWKMEKDWKLQLITKVFDSRNIPKILNLITSQKNVASDECGILSIDFADDRDNNVLVATKGATVVMFNLKGKNIEVVHQGHYKGQLWGLGTYQGSRQNRFIITGGDDCTVRMWNLESKEEVSRIYFDYPVRAVDCQQSDDNLIVVADKKAQLYMLNNKLKKTDTYTGVPYEKNYKSNQKQGPVHFDHFPWVEQIKFSPTGENICYGTHGQSQFAQIVPVNKDSFNSKQAKSFEVGSSAVNHVDWSRDGNSLAINTQAWQYRFFSLASINSKAEDLTVSASSMKDENWATYTRKYGFQSQGIFQGPDHTDLNTICRFITEPDKTNPKGILAVGYDDQSIRLFRYPAYNPNQVFKQYFGHSSHVTKIKFTDDKMISIGGLDRTVIVWKIDGIPEVTESKSKKVKKNEQEDVPGDDGLDDLDDDVDVPARVLKKKPKPVKQDDFTEVLDEGDEFMAVKPWLGAIKQPTYSYPKSNGVVPNASIQLSYVFGYRAKDCRQNLFYKDQNTIIFHAAAVLIEHNISSREQKLFNQHNDDILSIDYHQKTDRIVTGQLGPKPLVCFYQQGDFISSFKAPVKKGVIAIAISPNGNYAACVGMDDKHGMAVIDLENKTVVKLEETTNKLITKIKWRDNKEIIAVGINFYGEWSYTGKQIKLISKKAPKSNNVSLDVSPDGRTILVGANFSSLYDYSQGKGGKPVWTPKTEEDKQEPKSVVECIKITDKFIALGMRTGHVVFLDKKLNQIKTLSPWEFIQQKNYQIQKSQNQCIRAIDFLFEGKNIKMIIGTLGSQIYQFQIVQIDDKCQFVQQEPICIMKGHFAPNSTWTNEVWGLAIPQGFSEYALTCSDDSTIRIWNISDIPTLAYCQNINVNKVSIDPKTKKYPDDLRLRSIAVSPNREFIAIGAYDGTLRIFKLNLDKPDMMIIPTELYVKKVCKQWISDIKFGFKTLIVGSHDNAIYVFDFDLASEEREGKKDEKFDQIKSVSLKLKYRPMNKHSSYITHVDVSRDSCFLQSTCGAYEILFWDLNSGKQLPGGATMLKDEKWKTWTCNIGWPVQGIYPKEQDGTFINAVDRSNTTMSNETNYSNSKTDFYLLAAGNDHGKVCVYNYPSLVKNSAYIEGKGHSSHVTTVRWMANDEHIISVGGEDQCVMIWKVKKNVSSNYSVEKEEPKMKSTSVAKRK